MVQPIEEWNERARERAQWSIERRRERFFLYDSRATQERIVSLLEKMSNLIEQRGVPAARKYFFHETSRKVKPDSDIDVDEVKMQILFSIHFGDG